MTTSEVSKAFDDWNDSEDALLKAEDAVEVTAEAFRIARKEARCCGRREGVNEALADLANAIGIAESCNKDAVETFQAWYKLRGR